MGTGYKKRSQLPNNRSVLEISKSASRAPYNNISSIMSTSSPNHRRSTSKDVTLDGRSVRTQNDIQELTEIISSCNFLCDKYIPDDDEDDVSKKLDRYLTRREKFMYERIIAECGTSGDYKRLQASLMILQKLIRRKRKQKMDK